MKRLNKTVALGLFIPLLILNLPVQMPEQCISNAEMAMMRCCTEEGITITPPQQKISQLPCCCNLAESSNTEAALAHQQSIFNQNSKKIDKNFTSIFFNNESNLKQPFLSFMKLFGVSNLKMTSNTKIFSLVSSYLI
jgi:hypothetical protein